MSLFGRRFTKSSTLCCYNKMIKAIKIYFRKKFVFTIFVVYVKKNFECFTEYFILNVYKYIFQKHLFMKLKVIIRCHGNKPHHGCGKVMAHMCTSSPQSFIAITCSLFKLQLILLWKLSVDIYESKPYLGSYSYRSEKHQV